MKNTGTIKRKHTADILIFTAQLAAGFLFSGTRISGAAAFADISIAGASGLAGSAAVLTGSLLYCFLSGSIGRNIVKLSAMVMLLIAKLLMENKRDPKSCGIFTAVCVLLSGTAVSAVIGELVYKLIFYVFYSALAGFTAYSSGRIASDVRNGASADLTGFSGCFYAVVYTIYAASLCSINTPLVNIGIIIGVTATLLAAHFYGFGGGVAVGALTACAAFLADPKIGMTAVLLPAAGLFTGYITRRRASVSAGIFCAAVFMLMILTGMTENGIDIMLNCLCGTGVFLIISPYFPDKRIRTSEQYNAQLPEMAARRNAFVSDSLASVRRETSQIADMLAKKKTAEAETADELAAVCDKCYRRHLCRRQGSTALKGLEILGKMTEVSQETFPVELDTCIRRDRLIAARNRMVRSDTLARLMEMRTCDCRGLFGEQMKMAERLVRDSGKFPKLRHSQRVSNVIWEKLRKFGFEPDHVSACYGESGRLLAEMYFSAENAPASGTRICDLISDELRMALSISEPVSSGKQVRFRLFEKPAYSLEVCTASRRADGSEESGDTFTVFSDGTGIGYVVLSDGMGSGKEAAFESGLAAGLFRRLITCGIGHEAAVKIINSVMLTKSSEETFATLDILRIDLDTCGMTVIKSGSAPTLIRHGGSVIKIAAKTFPVGMYERSEAYIADCGFSEGDIAIMFSDGVSENEYLFVKELLMGGSDLKSIVDEICSKSRRFDPADRSDDVTVIGIRAISA